MSIGWGLALALASLWLPVRVLCGQSQAAQVPFVLPAPTGPFAVGTSSWHVADPQRSETFSQTAQSREVKVHAWYPASQRTSRAPSRAPYLRETSDEARAFAALVRQPGIFDHLARVTTHSVIDAPLFADSGRLPLLIFSHGYTGLASAYTALLEDLASHGFIVLSVIHPYESVAVRQSNGAVVTLLDSAGAMRSEIRAVIGEWDTEDSTMARVTRATGEDEQLRILGDYIRGLPKTQAVIDRWVADTKLVLDDFLLRRAGIPATLARTSDTARIGVLGHSMGGVVAGQFCVEDQRCRAALNLDGIPQSGTMIDRRMARPFLMVYSGRPGRLGASDAIYRRGAAVYYRVDVAGTRHIDFSDMNFWGGPLQPPAGIISPERAAEVTRTIVREYFGQELRGAPSAFLRGTRTLDGVRAHPPALGSSAEDLSRRGNHARRGFVQTDDGVRLAFSVRGTGRDTVIVPVAVWLEKEFQSMGNGRTWIFYDPRGRGRSDRVADSVRLGLEADVRDLEAIRSHFAVSKMALLGWSYFGAVVADYAKQFPQRVERLIQLHPISPRRDPYAEQDMAERRRRADGAEWETLQALRREGASTRDPEGYCRIANHFFFSLQVADTANLRRIGSDVCRFENEQPANLDRLFARAPASQPYDWREWIARLNVPTLVVHGERDPIPIAGSREWGMRANARVLVIPGAAHFAFAEQPAALMSALDQFLRGRWPRGAVRVAADTAVREGILELAGSSLAYDVRGSGPAVVLIHGGGFDRRLWDGQVDALARHFRVIRYDVRGAGRSGNTPMQ